MAERKGGVAWCQPFRVRDATICHYVAVSTSPFCARANKNLHNLQIPRYAASSVQRFNEAPQLHSRKFPETLLDLAFRPFEEDPARGAMPVAALEMDSTANGARAHIGIRLHLDVDLPAFVAALELAHVLGALLAGEGGAHGAVWRSGGRSWRFAVHSGIHYAPRDIPAS